MKCGDCGVEDFYLNFFFKNPKNEQKSLAHILSGWLLFLFLFFNFVK
jgi:hypothetical protein